MGIGASIFLVAVGAILRFAVVDDVKGVDVGVVGLILMIAGALGLALTMFLLGSRRNGAATGGVVEERRVYDDRNI
jgi:hypothetical protein